MWRPQCDSLPSHLGMHLSPGTTSGMQGRCQILCRAALPMEASPLTKLGILSSEMYWKTQYLHWPHGGIIGPVH